MCARYELNSPPQEMIERFGLSVPPSAFLDYQSLGVVRPTNIVPVIGINGVMDLISWGLDVPWQKQPVINARNVNAAPSGAAAAPTACASFILQIRPMPPATAIMAYAIIDR